MAASAFVTVSQRLNDEIAAEERALLIAALERGVSARPAALIGVLESSSGGNAAVGRYARAMLQTGRGQALGRQMALVLRGGDPRGSPIEFLSRSAVKDGSVWFPGADDAGFLVGLIARALETSSDPTAAGAALAAGLACPPRTEIETWREWLRNAAIMDRTSGARLSPPVLHVFDGSFRRATQ